MYAMFKHMTYFSFSRRHEDIIENGLGYNEDEIDGHPISVKVEEISDAKTPRESVKEV